MPSNSFEQYQNQVNDFNKKFGVNFSFNRYAIKLGQTNHMREFFTGGSDVSAEDFAYRSVAREIFREAVESMIAKKANSFDHTTFLNEFDKLMDNYREHCNQTGDKKPSKNGGWKNNVELINDMQGKIKDIPDDKSDFIKNNYIKRSLRLRDMRADIDGMGKDGNPVTAEELSRAIVYARALTKAVSERSGWWKAIHWFQGPAERRDLKALNAFIDSHRNSDIYEKAEAFANENAIGDIKSKFEAAKEEIKAKELLKPRRLKHIKQGYDRLIDKKVSEHVYEQILDTIGTSTSREDTKSAVSRGLILVVNKGTIQHMWSEFDKATTPEEKENALNTRAQKIFNDTFSAIQKLNGMNKHDSIVATQKITNLMLKQYSPATSDKAYDKFHENYFINDEKFMDEFMKKNFSNTEMSNDELKEFINGVKLDIETKKEKVSIPDSEIASKQVNKSEKHTEVPKLDIQAKIN